MVETNTVLHWYDLTCPFCYVGQSRDEILERNGLHVVDRPLQAHPEVPVGGIAMGARTGAMYEMLESEAEAAGLPLKWPPRLPNSRFALGVAEWLRVHYPTAAPMFRGSLYSAHFAKEEDIGDPAVVYGYAAAAGVAVDSVRQAVAAGVTDELLRESAREAGMYDVGGTPAWVIHGRLVSGLRPVEFFERMVAA